MNDRHRQAKITPEPSDGLFAALCRLFAFSGSSAPSRRCPSALLALAFAVFLLSATPVSAAEIHKLLYKLHFAGPQNLPSQLGPKAFGVAVDNSSGPSAGDVYVSHTAHTEYQAITLAGSPTGGSFTLGFESCTTGPVAYNATGEEVRTALEPCVGAGKLDVNERHPTSSGAVYSIFFGGFPETNVAQLSCDGSGLEPHGTATCTVETTAEGTPNAIAKFSASASSASFLCQITGGGSLAPEAAAECDASAPGPGAFETPRGVAVDPSSGLLYAIDAARHHVYQFEPSGHYTGKSLELGTPSEPHTVERLDVSAVTGNVFIADRTAKRVIEWDPVTEITKVFATEAGSPLAPFGSVVGVAVDNDPTSPAYKDVYVADPAGHVVDRFSAAGAYQCQITGLGSASTSSSECSKAAAGNPEGGFVNPGPLAVDLSDGHLYVGEPGEFDSVKREHTPRYVAEFAPGGDFLADIVARSTCTDQGCTLNPPGDPGALALSAASGDLFVASAASPDELYVYGPDSPIATTAKPANVSATSATLQGTVNPISIEITGCRFEYLEASAYDSEAAEPFASAQSAPCETEGGAPIGSGTSPVAVHAAVSLNANTGYAYRLHAENARASSNGEALLFGPPAAKTDVATELAQTSATLNGTVEPEDVPTEYRFEWGTEEGNYTHIEPPVSVPAGPGEVQVSRALSGLALGATYHYRLSVQSLSGAFHGADRSFTTLPAALIDAQPAASVGSSSATLQAYLDPLGTATSYHFQWATKAEFEAGHYGHSTATESAGSGTEPVLVEAKLEGLAPQAEYHFRLVSESAKGTIAGPDEPLSTEPAPGSCENEGRRTEQGKDALRLPECRAFEQVSPEEKGGSPVEGSAELRLAAGGDRLTFDAKGAFAGDAADIVLSHRYLAERSAAGWQTVGIDPAAASLGAARVVPPGENSSILTSPDLARSLWEGLYGNGVDPLYRSAALFIREPDGSFLKATPTMELPCCQNFESVKGGYGRTITVDEDLSKFIFFTIEPVEPAASPDRLPLDSPRLYEVEGFGSPSPVLRLLNVDPQGNQIAACDRSSPNSDSTIGFGGRAYHAGLTAFTVEGLSKFYEISADGSRVFFTAETHADRCRLGVYVRLGGTETVEISRPDPNQQCTTVACLTAPFGDARFAGASADGKRALFLGAGQVSDEGSQGSTNLYMYDEGRTSGHHLIDLSAGDASGAGPRVQGSLRIAKDGSRVYFLAQGLLSGQPNSLGQTAKAGAENLYLYDTATESVSFISQLSGEVSAVGAASAQISLTPDGRYLFFDTANSLTPDDKNEAEDLYRYDAATGAIARISVGHDREDENGNGGGQPARFVPENGARLSSGDEGYGFDYEYRRVGADGQTALFATARPLQQGDENAKPDLYEWHQGQVSLITPAAQNDPFSGADLLSASGRDLVFTSISELAPGDRDGLRDVYDARIGGGFKPPPPPEPCKVGGSAETCHGEGTKEGPQQGRGSEGFVGPHNPLECHKGFVKRHGKCVKKHARKKRKRHRHHKRAARHNRGGGK